MRKSKFTEEQIIRALKTPTPGSRSRSAMSVTARPA